MVRKNIYKNLNHKTYKANFLCSFIFRLLIILLSLISIKVFLNSGNEFILYSKFNEISLKVKGNGTFPIFYPSYNFKPSSYYLNDDQEPKIITNNKIFLPKDVNEVKLIFTNNVTSCKSMFQDCSNILEIDLTNFISSDVQSIDNMFYGCSSLKNIKFGNFQTTQIKNTVVNTFSGCSSLETLDLSSFNTSKIVHMHNMFYGCNSLRYLDFSNLDTSSHKCTINICKGGCKNLEIVNFKQAKISTKKLKVYNNWFASVVKNVVLCVDEYQITDVNELIGENSCSTRISDCSNWKQYQKKIVPKSSKCINDCAVTSYPYEYSGKCYKNCPFGTILDNYICKEQIKLDNLNPIEFKDLIKEKIYSYADSSNIMNGLNFVATISSSDEINPEEQIKNGISAFEFGNCINDLKVHYSIPKDENLIILNMEIQNQKNESNNNDNDKTYNLGKYNKLEIYDKRGNQLNLSICKENIKILRYIGDVNELNLDLAKNLSDQGIDIFNTQDKFFNDLCYEYNNPNGLDIIIDDRRNDFYQNASFCQIGCAYSGINYTLMVANCICNSTYIQEWEGDITENNEINNFKTFKQLLLSNLLGFNFDVLKCYNLVVKLKILQRNIGFYSLFLMLIFQIIFFVIYLVKQLTSVKNFMISLKSQINNNNRKNSNKMVIKVIKNENKKNNNDEIIRNEVKLSPPHKNKNALKVNKSLDKNNRKINRKKSNFNSYFSKSSLISLNGQILKVYNQENLKEINNDKKSNKFKQFIKGKEIIKNNNNSIYNIKNNNKLNKKMNNLNQNLEINNNNDKIKIKNEDTIKLFKTINDIQNIDYEEAVLYDKRGYLRMYWGFLAETQIIFGTFCTDNHLDLFIIKLSFFVFTFQISFFLNALFYTDKYISDAYHNNGVLDIISGLPKSIYSYVATLITINLLRMLSNNKNELVKLIKEKLRYKSYIDLVQLKLENLSKKLIIYFILLFLLTFSFLYYTTSFCAVYRNSQKYWFLGCLESLGIDSAISFFICFFLAFFRYISIKKRVKCFYILANIITTFL